MTRWRRSLDIVLLSGLILISVVSLVVIVATINAVRETRDSFNDNLTYYVGQVEYETLRLLDTVARFGEKDGTVSEADVQIRFDIVWSRVFVDRDDLLGQDTETSRLAAEKVGAYRDVLLELDPLILELDSGDTETIQQVRAELRALVPLAHSLRLAAEQARVEKQAWFLQNQLQQAYLVFGLILGMAVVGVFSVISLRADRREIRVMNSQLEHRVKRRTEDLQAANLRLAAEIKERRRSQELAADREARLEQAVQLAKMGYYSWDSIQDHCDFCSGQHAASYGMTPEEFRSSAESRQGTLAMVHPEDRERLRTEYDRLRDGHMIEVGFRVLTPVGLRRIREVARPLRDLSGRVVREIGATLDVTDQYDTEMKLFEAQKMDSIGKMTGGVAHDFNNLLAVILGNLELLRELPEAEDREQMIEDAIKATFRGRDLTMNMLSFARRAPHDPKDLNLNGVLSEMQAMLRRTLPESIDVKADLTREPWIVAADRSLTESAVLNLAINARDAMPTGGTLTIRTKNIAVAEGSQVAMKEDLEPGNYVMMSVADTGRGIKDELLAHIFEPFFTTKAIAKNSGLGLSMVQGFIRQTGGAVSVSSVPDKGTVFRLYFKATQKTAPEPKTASRNPSVNFGGARKVLLVEDDATVRKILSRQLEKCGMSVVSAAESTSAEHAFRNSGPFDIVVSDIVMPGDLQGPALVKRLRESDPNLPAVLLSGYPKESLDNSRDLCPDDTILMKPIGRDDLLAAIDNAVALYRSAVG